MIKVPCNRKRAGFLFFFLLIMCSVGSHAALLTVEFEIPEIDAAEYHRPYVAIWIEDMNRKQVLQIVHWLEQEKWHRDLRSWWRRGGSKLNLPVDSVTGATRKPGNYAIAIEANLPTGQYTLNLEAVREVGGREHLRIPFEWQGKPLRGSLIGNSELGKVKFYFSKEID